MNLTKKRKKKGFTLIELMAVIAIIAILAAVLVPTVSGYINRAKKTAVITQVSTAITAIETYNATAATAISSTDNEMTIEEVQKEIGDDFLPNENISKITSMSVADAYTINKSQDAINMIKLDDSTGAFESIE